ncbi:hypothetical protein [Arcticibacter tournemirensis]
MCHTKEEAKAAFDCLTAEFFSHYSLQESRELLWFWFKATVSGNYCRLPHLERDNLITFYEELDQLVETVWNLHVQGEGALHA